MVLKTQNQNITMALFVYYLLKLASLNQPSLLVLCTGLFLILSCFFFVLMKNTELLLLWLFSLSIFKNVSSTSLFYGMSLKAFQPSFPMLLKYAELLFNYYCPSWGYWRETRDTGYWILCGGRPWWEHQGRDMLLYWGLDQVQPQSFGWCLWEDGCAGPNWTT